MAHLVIRLKGEREWLVNLRRAETILGRGPQCQVRLPDDDRVSKVHAQILRDQAGYWIENRSKNNTSLNGRMIDSLTPLRQGDRIAIIGYTLQFIDDVDEPLPEPRYRIVSRFRQSDVTPELPGDSRASAVLEFCRSACQTSLRRAELLDHFGGLLNAVSPNAEVIGLFLRRSDLKQRLHLDVEFPLEGQSGRLTPDLNMAYECLDEHSGLLCEALDGMDLAGDLEEAGSAIAVPIGTGDVGPLGVLWLAAASKIIDHRDAQLAFWLASVLAAALDNSRTHESAVNAALKAGDNKVARQIQKQLLPSELPKANDYEFFHLYEPAMSVGGDYFDYVWLPNRRLAILVADVAGKGVPAAILMSRFSAEARNCLRLHPDDPAKAVEELNREMYDVIGDRFVTLVVCILTPAAHRVEIVCAGHDPPLILRTGSKLLESTVALDLVGFAVGVVADTTYVAKEIRLHPGDFLLLFTDGVTDARNSSDNRFSLETLLEVPGRTLALHKQGGSAAALGQAVINEVTDHNADHPQFDDITLVCFGREREDASSDDGTGTTTGDFGPAAK